jgi:hypothetical protein
MRSIAIGGAGCVPGSAAMRNQPQEPRTNRGVRSADLLRLVFDTVAFDAVISWGFEFALFARKLAAVIDRRYRAEASY